MWDFQHFSLFQVSFFFACVTVVFNLPPNSPPLPILQVYSRRQRSYHSLDDSLLLSNPPCPLASTIESELIFAPCKGICSTYNPSPHYTSLSYHTSSPSFYAYLLSISTTSIPKLVGDALGHPSWCQTMFDEINALRSSVGSLLSKLLP